MVVEHSAHFPDGSNGMEYYDDVVRMVVDLEIMANPGPDGIVGGTEEIELPAAWDGDDLSLVVVHEWFSMGSDAPPNSESSSDPYLPGFLAPPTLIALGAAALARRE